MNGKGFKIEKERKKKVGGKKRGRILEEREKEKIGDI